MQRTRTSRLTAHGIVTVVALAAGLGLGRPELIAVAAGPALLIGMGLLRSRRHDPRVDVSIDNRRAIEGDAIDLAVALSARHRVDALEVTLTLPEGLTVDAVHDDAADRMLDRRHATVVVNLGPGRPHRLRYAVRCSDWGVYTSGVVDLSHVDALGYFVHRRSTAFGYDVKVFPPELGLRSLLDPAATQLNLGELVSPQPGEGIEFADLRPYASGDDPRRINWRASARRGHPWVNERHPERNSDVVLVVDPLAGLRVDTTELLDYAVRAAASVAAGHLGRRDRVGLLLIGGSMLWLRPRMFDLQRHRILDALARSRLQLGSSGPVAVAHRGLPPNALLVGLTSLLDERAVAVFEDLAGRGHDLALVEIDITRQLAEPSGREERLARRIWSLRRETTRRRFRRRGVAVAKWEVERPFEDAMEEVIAFRRHVRRART